MASSDEPSRSLVARWARTIVQKWHSSDPALRWAIQTFLLMRVLLSLWAGLTMHWVPLYLSEETPDGQLYREVVPYSNPITDFTLGVWYRWDTVWYMRIAVSGYSHEDGSSAFPPLYPFSIRLLGNIMARNYLLASVIISNLSYLGALIYLYKLASEEFPDRIARRTTLYLSIFPTAFFLLAGYTESLFLLLVTAAFYYALKERWLLTGVLAFLAPLTRAQGLVLFFPLAYEYLRQRKFNLRSLDWRSLAPFAAPLASLSFSLFRHLQGYPPFAEAYKAEWSVSVVPPWQSLVDAGRQVLRGQSEFIHLVDLGLTSLFIVLTIIALRKLPDIYGLYTVPTFLFLLLRSVPGEPLHSLSRYLLLLFPNFMVLALIGENRWTHRLIIFSSIPLLALLTGLFGQRIWVA